MASIPLTPEMHASICADAAKGIPPRHIACGLGIHPATLHRWLAKGRQGDPKYVSLSDDYARARSHDVAERLARIDLGAKGGAVVREVTRTDARGNVIVERSYAAPDWRADAWIMERRYAEEYYLDRKEVVALLKRVAELEARAGVPPLKLAGSANGHLPSADAPPGSANGTNGHH